MAINHIDQVRKAMPQHFQDLDHLLPLDDYLVIETTEPEQINEENEDGEILNKLSDDDYNDPSSDLEEVLEEIDDFEPLEDPTPDELELFGGHPGGLLRPR